MTNAVVWLEEETSKVWSVADSLITAIGGSSAIPRAGARRVTDQAMKIMRLSVGAWGTTKYSVAGGPFIGYDVGMVYAGAVTPAVMTHGAASMILANLHPQTATSRRIYTPAFHRVAELIRYLSERYIKDAALAYSRNPLFCEFVIFAIPPAQDEDLPPMDSWRDTRSDSERTKWNGKLNGGFLDCYWIHPGKNLLGEYSQVIERINLLGGEVAVIGDDTLALRNDIAQLRAASGGKLIAQPRVALERRIRAMKHDTVGGTLQFGVMENGKMDLLGAMQDAHGSPAQNWLGFECEIEINPIMGMPVVIPSLD